MLRVFVTNDRASTGNARGANANAGETQQNSTDLDNMLSLMMVFCADVARKRIVTE